MSFRRKKWENYSYSLLFFVCSDSTPCPHQATVKMNRSIVSATAFLEIEKIVAFCFSAYPQGCLSEGYVSIPPIFLSWGLPGMPGMLVPLVRIFPIILFVIFAVALVVISSLLLRSVMIKTVMMFATPLPE
jgi:hypothetical protein